MKTLIKLLIIFFLFIAGGCLKDNNVPVVSFEMDKTARILRYIEGQGDYINSDQVPSLITANEVYNNLDQMIILDIRSDNEYLLGHIPNSINILPNRLYEVTDSLYRLSPAKNIVIVSKNGQASAYFVCLLQLAGFHNTYSLKYGMAYWNRIFADEWIAAISTNDGMQSYDNKLYPKPAMSDLPSINFPNSFTSDKELAMYRIKEVIKYGFVKDKNYSEEFTLSIKRSHVKVCYGSFYLYYVTPIQHGGPGHEKGTFWYWDNPVFDLKSKDSLQTLPSNEPIILYSGDGQLGAAVTAYLTVLGYNVKTLMFGANQLFYSRMVSNPSLLDDAFKPEEIKNYPYVTGN